MIFDKEGNTTIVLQEATSLGKFRLGLKEAYPRLRNDNLIVNLSAFSKLQPEDVLEFLELSAWHRAAKKSFVMVTDRVSYEDVPEDLCVVPTLQEARDIIEMEEIERELGI